MIYNLDKINEMAEGDEDFINSVISVFLEEVPQDLELLEVALNEQNHDQVYKLAHKIKPNVDLLGMYLVLYTDDTYCGTVIVVVSYCLMHFLSYLVLFID